MAQQNLLEELDEIRLQVRDITCKLDLIEKNAISNKVEPVTSNSKKIKLKSLPASIRCDFDESYIATAAPGGYIVTSKDSTPKQGAHNHERPDMEVQIGTFWLNRIGIFSLVLGVVFLILYSFQYFGVVAKLSLGYLISTALIFGGEKISKQKERDWYGNALIGGGWSLLYFTAYAMHFIPALKVVHSFAGELFILCGIAASAMRHAVYKKSESLAIIATLLGVGAIAFGQPSHLSYLGYMTITAGAVYIAVSQKWIKVFYVAVVTCYVAHLSTSVALGLPRGNLTIIDSVWALGSLFSSWLAFTTALNGFARIERENHTHLLTISWLNALYLTVSVFIFAQGALVSSIYLLLAGAAACYLLSSHILRKQQLQLLADTHTLIGLSLLTMAIGNKLEGVTRLNAFLAEASTIAFIYLQHGNRVYKWFAPSLILLTFMQWLLASLTQVQSGNIPWMGTVSPEHCLSGAFGAAVCCALAWLHKKHVSISATANNDFSEPNDKDVQNLYIILANLFGLFIPVLIESIEARAMYWLALTCINAFSYYRADKPIYQTFTNIALVLTVLTAIFFSCREVTFISFLLSGLLFGLDWLASLITKNYKSSFRTFGHAALILSLTLVFQLPTQLISVGLGILGLSSLIMGFSVQIKTYRAWGLFALGLLTCRLVLIDLAHENTIERIIAFTVSGAILLFGSYAYAKFAETKTRDT